ncbi:hypothetical protein [Bradyrhizobium tropiciagri]|nr:hypothetical protein [Bradyrhizobium tropiciagri]
MMYDDAGVGAHQQVILHRTAQAVIAVDENEVGLQPVNMRSDQRRG